MLPERSNSDKDSSAVPSNPFQSEVNLDLEFLTHQSDELSRSESLEQVQARVQAAWQVGELEEGLTAAQAAVIISSRDLGEHSPELGLALMNLGSFQREAGQFPEANSSFQQASAILLQDEQTYLPELAKVREEQGELASLEGDIDSARIFFLAAKDHYGKLLDARPKGATFTKKELQQAGQSQIGLGLNLVGVGEIAAAQQVFERAVELIAPSAGKVKAYCIVAAYCIEERQFGMAKTYAEKAYSQHCNAAGSGRDADPRLRRQIDELRHYFAA